METGLDGGKELGDKIDKLIEQMEKNEEDLINKNVTDQTIERQQDILTRLLEAESAVKERGQEEERKAQTANQYEISIPESINEYLKAKEKEIELLKTIPAKLNPYYKKETNKYFKKIKQQNWSPSMNAINIQIPSLVENIRIVESFIDNAKDKYDLDDDIYGNIMIAVIESVNNAIVHGNSGDKQKNVDLSVQFEEEQIKFIIQDEGNGFNFSDLPDPTAPENLERTGGRGIFLMKHLADEVNFANDGQRVELTFYLG